MADQNSTPWPPRDLLDRFDGLTDLETLRASLEELRGGITAHFDAEEASNGMLDKILDEAPQHDARVAAIKREHREMVEGLDGLTERLDAVVNGPLAEIHQGLQGLKERLLQHEADEAELLNDTMLADLGGHN